MKHSVLVEQETRWCFRVSVPVSEDEDAKTITMRVEVEGPYPSMYFAGVSHPHTMLTDVERQFAVEQAKKFVYELVRNRP